MSKTNLTKRAKSEGTFVRLTPDFKKKAKIYCIENGMTLTDLFVNSVNEKMNGK